MRLLEWFWTAHEQIGLISPPPASRTHPSRLIDAPSHCLFREGLCSPSPCMQFSSRSFGSFPPGSYQFGLVNGKCLGYINGMLSPLGLSEIRKKSPLTYHLLSYQLGHSQSHFRILSHVKRYHSENTTPYYLSRAKDHNTMSCPSQTFAPIPSSRRAAISILNNNNNEGDGDGGEPHQPLDPGKLPSDKRHSIAPPRRFVLCLHVPIPPSSRCRAWYIVFPSPHIYLPPSCLRLTHRALHTRTGTKTLSSLGRVREMIPHATPTLRTTESSHLCRKQTQSEPRSGRDEGVCYKEANVRGEQCYCARARAMAPMICCHLLCLLGVIRCVDPPRHERATRSIKINW